MNEYVKIYSLLAQLNLPLVKIPSLTDVKKIVEHYHQSTIHHVLLQVSQNTF